MLIDLNLATRNDSSSGRAALGLMSYSEPGPSSLSRRLGVTSSTGAHTAALLAGGSKAALTDET